MRYRQLLQVILSIIVLFGTTACSISSAPDRSAPPETAIGGLSIPLHFEQNAGQYPAEVEYISRGKGHTIFLTPRKTVLALKGNQDGSGANIGIKVVGGAANPRLHGADKLSSKSNYFIGDDPQQWKTQIPHFKKVRYESVYDGIDQVFYGTEEGRLEYDFIVEPGANYKEILLDIQGAEQLHTNSRGDLLIETAGGTLVQHAPEVYQERNGEKVQIASAYTFAEKNRIGFAIGAYDETLPLIIDPVLNYSSYLGGSGVDEIRSVALDESGNIYVTGYTRSSDYPTTTGAFDETINETTSGDVFVTKINAAGSAIVYSTYVGGATRWETGSGIDVDSTGAAYVGGETGSSDFPTTTGAFDEVYANANDAFAFKLSADGSSLVYSTFLGGGGTDRIYDVVVDGSGNAYFTGESVAGDTTATGGAYPTTANAFQPVHPDVGNNAKDQSPKDGIPEGDSIWRAAILTVLNSAGTPTYSTFLGGPQGAFFDTIGYAIALGADGTVYITGSTREPGFPATTGAYDTSFNDPNWPDPTEIPLGVDSSADEDAFVAKFDVTKSGAASLVYATFLGGGGAPTGSDYAYAITVDALGSAYVTGASFSSDFPTTTGAFQETSGQAGGFVAKLNPAGSDLVFSTFLSTDGGSQFDFGQGIALDASGNVVVAGTTGAMGFPVVNPLQPFMLSPRYNSGNPSGNKSFVSILKPDGSDLLFSTYLGGCSWEETKDMALDSSGRPLVVGTTAATNFPTLNPLQATFGGGPSSYEGDGFLYRLDPGSDLSAELEITMTGPSGDVYIGDEVPFTITVKNNGPDTAPAVEVRDYADDDNFDFVSAIPSQGTCANDCLTGRTTSDHGITCLLGDLADGDEVTIQLKLKPLATYGSHEAMVYSSFVSDPNTGGSFPTYNARSGNNIARVSIRPINPCGNGQLDAGEECDAGTQNGQTGSGCSSACTVVDSDGDGIPDNEDGCLNDPDKAAPGACGCGIPDTDSDSDQVADCNEECDNDPNKQTAGACGCGVPDTDSDGDKLADCLDECPGDPLKIAPGECGCGLIDTDSDGDSVLDCNDLCPDDPEKSAPGICGCAMPDVDSDNDGKFDCNDACPDDPEKDAIGLCGCGVSDVDSDDDGSPDCEDDCPLNPGKITPGICGCVLDDKDTDGDGTFDCFDTCPEDDSITEGDCVPPVADCDEQNITSTLLDMDGSALKLKRVGRRARRVLIKATGNRGAGKGPGNANNELYEIAWTQTWSVPDTVFSNCANPELCVQVSNTVQLEQFTGAINQLYVNNKKLLSQLKRALGGKTKKWRRLKKRNLKAQKAALEFAATVPDTGLSCL